MCAQPLTDLSLLCYSQMQGLRLASSVEDQIFICCNINNLFILNSFHYPRITKLKLSCIVYLHDHK